MIVVRGNRIVFSDAVRAAAIQIEDGVIVDVQPLDRDTAPAASPTPDAVFDAGDLIVSPGIVDTHVHVNEPGRSDWEGFDTATQAAAAGGVTTLVDMPLNSIPATTTVLALDAKRLAARGVAHVDVAFWGGVVPGNAAHLDALVDAGVRGFKCFLSPSGVDEFPAVGEADLRAAMPILARRAVPLLVHAESPAVLADVARRLPADPGNETAMPFYADYLATRPPAAEVAAIALMVRLAREYGTHIHIVHVASEEAVAAIEAAKADGVPITAETCPHYLTFAAEEVPRGATEFKCAPPIREARHRHALWHALRRGALDLVATDHSPAPPAMKPQGDFNRAWGGIASLELSLPAMWTGLRRDPLQGTVSGDRALMDLARWLSAAPARLAGLERRKGRIAPGFDGDLVVWDADADTTVDPRRLRQRHKLTPYAGRRLRGTIKATFLRGERIWDGERMTIERHGDLL